MTKAYCGGTFDLLHPGQVRFFKWASETFDTVVAALNRDEFIERYKGKKPTQSLDDRMEMVLSCRYVDSVVVNIGDEDSKPSILAVRPTHVVNGSDWSRARLMKQMDLTEEFLAAFGIKIALCPLAREYSTTELKRRIRGC